MNRIENLHSLGQSIWYDNIQRRLLESGEMEELIRSGDIRGVTSNPSIFNNAIAKTHDYDAALKPMAWAGWTAEQIFYQLAVEDIRAAADLFRELYDQTQGGDGYVSLEVNPTLAHDAEGTAAEAKRLWEWVNRPNLMVKIPATLEGLAAIRKTIAAGVNVNVTLIFSLERYAAVIDAYLGGLEDRLAAGLPVSGIASVASFFISRADTKVDGQLQSIVQKAGPHAQKATHLLGKAAIANAKLAYALFQESVASERFKKLKSQGARVQRPLWASTSTKNPAYRDVIYVEDLIGPDTVNTMPPQTLDAFREHGEAHLTLTQGVDQARQDLSELETLGIAMSAVTQELEIEGVKSFAEAFAAMLKAIEDRRQSALAELGPLQSAVAGRVKQLEDSQFTRRIYAGDATLWTEDPAGQDEVRKRLGWLKAPEVSHSLLAELPAFLQACQTEGYTHALLLGMGGSSLAPEVMALTFGVREQTGTVGLDLAILDSTDPAQVRAAARRATVGDTLYIVASKSGTTSEVNAYFDYFWARATRRLGQRAGQHFIAITDPGTAVEKLALERGFRHVFRADPNVGGRYSALTAFGVVPAALLGLDVKRFLDRGQWMATQCQADVPAARNPGLVLGAVLGEATLAGRDKLTLLADPELASIGAWIEQLVAESSGKHGKGIVPIDLEPQAQSYGSDRLFVYLRQSGTLADFADKLRKSGQPVLELSVPEEYHLAAEFYRWEYATAVACSILDENAFDQPDVQDSKNRTKQKIASYREVGKFDEGKPSWNGNDGQVYGQISDEQGAQLREIEDARTLGELITQFLKQVKPGDYVAINAYLPRNSTTFGRLQKLRKAIQKMTGVATTLGFGPRFLHSTGQLHKGGADNGVFIQITADPSQDLDIPEEGITFGVLERAQALGDLEALQARGRRAIRVHLEKGSFPAL
jgi:transaldolase/glucose-6-phosphate isomerase